MFLTEQTPQSDTRNSNLLFCFFSLSNVSRVADMFMFITGYGFVGIEDTSPNMCRPSFFISHKRPEKSKCNRLAAVFAELLPRQRRRKIFSIGCSIIHLLHSPSSHHDYRYSWKV